MGIATTYGGLLVLALAATLPQCPQAPAVRTQAAATPAPTYEMPLKSQIDPDATADGFGYFCSLYCAADPFTEVSKHLEPQGNSSYSEYQLTDDDAKTAWVAKGGPTEFFEFRFTAYQHPEETIDFAKYKLGVDALHVVNGYTRSAEHWREHSRVKLLSLAVDGEKVGEIELLDIPEPQKVMLPPTLLHDGIKFRFTILSVYAGTRFDETALSEARLDGFGHH